MSTPKKGAKKTPAKAKSTRVSVPAGAKVFIVKDGQPYPPGLKEIIDITVKNELDVIAQKQEEMRRNATTASRAMTTQEVYEKVAGLILGAPFRTQTAVLAKVFERVKTSRTAYLFDLNRQHEHITEQRDLAQQMIYDLQNIQNGSAIIIE